MPQVADLLIPSLIHLHPHFYFLKLAEASTQVKSVREKQLILDIIIKHSSLFFNFAPITKSNKKVSSIIKMMCQHISTSPNKDKELPLAALAVISQFKSKYPDEVLTALICQNDKTLTRII